jgi:VanZ family protein
MTEPARKASGTRVLPFVCLVVSIGLLIAGLWPFRFLPPNNVHWIAGQPGLRFDRYGIVVANSPLFGPDRPSDPAKPFSIAIDLRPAEEPDNSLPRIFSVYDAQGRELFFIGQWKSELIVRISVAKDRTGRGYQEIGIGNFSKGARKTYVLHFDSRGIVIFSGGKTVAARFDDPRSALSDMHGPAGVVLGNSPSGRAPWQGDILSLSISNGALLPGEAQRSKMEPRLRYRLSEGNGAVAGGGTDPRYDLLIPRTFRPPVPAVLVPPWEVEKFNLGFWKDVFVNVFGFIPFGFAVFAWLSKNQGKGSHLSTIFAVLAGAGISLSIELLQIYLPTRDSSLTDVLSNILGPCAGILFFRGVRRLGYR